MRRLALFVLLAGCLGGCATAAQDRAAQAAADDRACQAAGEVPGTNGYRQCRSAREQQRQKANADFLRATVAGPEMTPLMPMR